MTDPQLKGSIQTELDKCEQNRSQGNFHSITVIVNDFC